MSCNKVCQAVRVPITMTSSGNICLKSDGSIHILTYSSVHVVIQVKMKREVLTLHIHNSSFLLCLRSSKGSSCCSIDLVCGSKLK